jgi:hypothetical protein
MIYIRDNKDVSYQNVDMTFHYLSWVQAHIYSLDEWPGCLHETEKGHLIIGPTNLGFWSEE